MQKRARQQAVPLISGNDADRPHAPAFGDSVDADRILVGEDQQVDDDQGVGDVRLGDGGGARNRRGFHRLFCPHAIRTPVADRRLDHALRADRLVAS